MTPRLNIAIIGYGIAGIAAAILLRRQGHAITHFEQAKAPGPAGSGLLLQPAGRAVLRELGLQESVLACGALVTRMVARNAHGRRVMDMPYRYGNRDSFAIGLQRGALFRLLQQADTHHGELCAGQSIVAVSTASGLLQSAQGASLGPFDLVIAADGARSRLRRSAPALLRAEHPYPWQAQICLLDDPERQFAGRVMQYFSGTRHVSVWPVGVLAPREPHRINLSSNIHLQPDGFEGWKADVLALCPQIAPQLHKILGPEALVQGHYRHVGLRRFYQDRLVLIGDAAHSMSPQLGLGASMALLDASVLAYAVAQYDELSAALACFDTQRRRAAHFSQQVSRVLTPLFQSHGRILSAARNRLFFPLTRLPQARHMAMSLLHGGGVPTYPPA